MIHEQPTRAGYLDQAIRAIHGYRLMVYRQLDPKQIGYEDGEPCEPIETVDRTLGGVLSVLRQTEKTVVTLLDVERRLADYDREVGCGEAWNAGE